MLTTAPAAMTEQSSTAATVDMPKHLGVFICNFLLVDRNVPKSLKFRNQSVNSTTPLKPFPVNRRQMPKMRRKKI